MKCPNVSSISITIVYLCFCFDSCDNGGKYGTLFNDLLFCDKLFFSEFNLAFEIFFSKIVYKKVFKHMSI